MKGRRLYQFMLAMADCAARSGEFLPADVSLQSGEAFSKTARSLRDSDDWCVTGLAVCTIAVKPGSLKGRNHLKGGKAIILGSTKEMKLNQQTEEGVTTVCLRKSVGLPPRIDRMERR
jgi:hypothetical protein